MTITTHPDATTLAAFGLGQLQGAERAAVEAHVAECTDCCRALEGVNADSLVDLARAAMATNPIAQMETLPPDIPTALVDHPRYKVLNRIGAGGMGAVYKAEHRMMGRIVALKVMAPGLLADPDALDRFRREVRLASKLSHPNIVTAHDADEAAGLHFLVMEHVEGASLHRLVVKKGPLAPALACHLVRQAALGLQHAFEKGMVHRDIKPHNLMVTRKGQVKILDFGLARLTNPADITSATHAGGVTAPDIVLGTPDFLSPEQARNSANADIRADLYSLGCTLYFLLTGKPPFPRDTAMAKLIAHVEDEPEPVSASRTDVPAGLLDVLTKLMAKDPANRPQTPADAAALLTPFTKPAGAEPAGQEAIVDAVLSLEPLADLDVPATATFAKRTKRGKRRPAKRSRNRRAWLMAAGGGLAAVIAVAAIFASGIAGKRDGGPQSPGEPLAKGSPAASKGSMPAGARRPYRVVMVLPSQMFWNPDYEPVRKVLEAGNACRVSVASLAFDKARPDARGGGSPVSVDLPLNKLKAEDWDAVVVVGGEGVTELLNFRSGGSQASPPHVVISQFLTDMAAKNRVVAAICMAPGILADAGLLDGRRATMMPNYRGKWKDVNWQDGDLYTDGPIITARDASAAQPFAEAVMVELRKRSPR